MQGNPSPLDNLFGPVVITALINLLVQGGQWYAKRHADEVTLRSTEAQQLNAHQDQLRAELRADLDRERAWRQALQTEMEQMRLQQAEALREIREAEHQCQEEREAIRERVQLLERRLGMEGA